MRKITFIIFNFLLIGVYAQNLDWAKGVGGPGGYSTNDNIVVDASGNVYSCGQFVGTKDFDPGAGTFNMTSSGSADAYLLKLDASGNFVWAKKWGGSAMEYANGLAINSAGEIIVCGSYVYEIDFDPNAGITLLGVTSNVNTYVVKYDTSGNLIWAKSTNTGGSGVYCFGLTVDNSDNIAVIGTYYNTADFDPNAGVTNMTNPNGEGIYIWKLSSLGNLVWVKEFQSTTGSRRGLKIDSDVSGNLYSTGYFAGTVDFDPNAGIGNLTSNGIYDAFICKLDANGNFAWAKQIGGTGTDYGNNILVDANGNVFTTGYYVNTADFDTGAGISNISSNGGKDIFITKLDVNGNYIWGKSLGSTGDDEGLCLANDISDNLYLSGTFNGTMDFDPNATIYNLNPTGGTDGFVLKLSSAGNFTWASPIGGSGTDNTKTIFVDNASKVYTSGVFASTVDFDPSISGVFNLTAIGGDFYVQKWTQCSTVSASTISQQNVLCNSGNTGSAEVLGSGGSGFSYSWSPSGGTNALATNLAAGVYNCTITNSCGNTTIQTITITQPTALTSSISSQTNNLCNGGSTGSATISVNGGTSAYSYSWSPSGGTSNSITNLSAGTYSCTITDGNSCSIVQNVTISQPNAIVPTIVSQSSVSCNGQTDGQVTISANGGTGGLSYLWLPGGQTSTTLTNLNPGNYFCTVSDANGCSQNQTVTITEPDLISINSTQSNVSCNGLTDGTANISISGGTAPYSINWLPSGGTNTSITNLSEGTYSCAIVDANGCFASHNIVITEPSPINILTSMVGSTISSLQNGAIYQWIDCSNLTDISSETGQNFTANNNGSYAVIINQGVCSDTSSCVLIEGLNLDENLNEEFSIYPNPVDNKLNILISESISRICIKNLNGQILFIQTNNLTNSIDISTLSSGTYFIEVNNQKTLFIKK